MVAGERWNWYAAGTVDRPCIAYRARDDVTPEAEVSALAAVYKFVLNRNAASVTSTNGGDEKERSRNDSLAKTRIP